MASRYVTPVEVAQALQRWEEHKKKLLRRPRNQECLKCKTVFVKGKKPHKTQGYCSRKCMEIMSPRVTTKKAAKAAVYRKITTSTSFYTTREWQALRYETIKKYERKCMVCFRTGLELHVDHIKPISKFPELALSANNLQVLCRDCNMGKGNKDSIDWR